MQIHDRIPFLLGNLASPGAVLWLVKILQRIASTGQSYIREVVTTPKLLNNLFDVLDAPEPTDKEDLLANAKWAAASEIMQLSAILCRGGVAVISLLAEKGAFNFLVRETAPLQWNFFFDDSNANTGNSSLSTGPIILLLKEILAPNAKQASARDQLHYLEHISDIVLWRKCKKQYMIAGLEQHVRRMLMSSIYATQRKSSSSVHLKVRPVKTQHSCALPFLQRLLPVVSKVRYCELEGEPIFWLDCLLVV